MSAPHPQLWRITDRATFRALRRGRRARAGLVSVTWLAPEGAAAGSPPRVAFAVGRAAGGAVVRNRIRRRLRAGLRDLLQRDALPAGTYLVGAGPAAATAPWAELVADLDAAVAAATGRAA